MPDSGVTKYGYGAARACAFIFACAVAISYAYVLIIGEYNGDFYGVPETLGVLGQTVIFAASVLPYVFGWQLYKFYKRRRVPRTIPLPPGRVTAAFFVFVIWFIVLALTYGVGVMGKPLYEAPGAITPLIQLTNRINPFYLGVLFILVHQGSRKVLWLGIGLLVCLGIARAGLGVVLYIGLALIVRNYSSLSSYFRANTLKIAFVALIVPAAVGQLYALRSMLREDASEEVVMSAVEIVAAKLVGRLSSYSDSAVVIQKTEHFRAAVGQLNPFYFSQQMFGGIFGVAFLPEVTPERMLINVDGGDYADVSFMLGTVGNLYVAWLISPAITLLNIGMIVIMCNLTFIIARRLGTPLATEFAFVLLLYPLTSGVGSEFSSLIATLVAFCVLFALLTVPLIPRVARKRAPGH